MSKPIQRGIMSIDENIDTLTKRLNSIKTDIAEIKSELKQILIIINEDTKERKKEEIRITTNKRDDNNSWWWS